MTTVEFDPQTFFRFLHSSFISRNGFQYKIGMNHDTQAFDPSAMCSPGLFYVTIDYLKDFENQGYGDHIAIVKIPVGVPIIPVGEDKFKSPCVYIESIHLYTDFLKNDTIVPEIKRTMKVPDLRIGLFQFDTEACLQAVKKNGFNIQYIKQQFITDSDIYKELCFEAVKKDGRAVVYIKKEFLDEDTYKEICIEAVKNSSSIITSIPEQFVDKEVFFRAVKNVGIDHFLKTIFIDKYFPLFTYENWLEIVKNRGEDIKYVPEKYVTKELCFSALIEGKEEMAIFVISNIFLVYDFPSLNIWKKIIDYTGNIKLIHPSFLTEEVCLYAIKKDWSNALSSSIPVNLRLLNKSFCMNAIELFPKRKKYRKLEYFLENICLRDEEICEKAIEKDPYCIKHIITHYVGDTKKLCIKAVEKDGKVFFCLSYGFQTDNDVCRAAIASHGNVIKAFIVNETFRNCTNFQLCEIAISAVEQNPFSVRWAVPFFNKYYKGDKTDAEYKEYYNMICKSAIRKDYRCISYIKHKTDFFDLISDVKHKKIYFTDRFLFNKGIR